MSRGDIVVAHQSEIEVYASDSGYVCVRMTDIDGEERTVTIQPIHVAAVTKAMLGCVTQAQSARQAWVREDEDDAS